MAHVYALLMLLTLLGGCTHRSTPQALAPPETSEPEPDPRLPGRPGDPRVVVAVIDTGINVYHEWFQRGSSLNDEILTQFMDASTGHPPQRVSLAQAGSYEERASADEKTWRSLQPETLYYFEGTNVVGISFDLPDASRRLVLDDAGHGTGTAGALVAANPNAIVVMVEGISSAAETWVAKQGWIDIFSMSYGPIGSVPGTGPVFGLKTHVATKAGWALGQLPVGAADNSPAPSPNDETSGPPWTVAVAGDEPAQACREHRSGLFPDFTSNFTQDLPRFDDVEKTRPLSGTSFATPKTAGTFSGVLREVRQAWGHEGGIHDGALALGPGGARLTNADLREAFNRTALYFPPTGCSPGPGPLPVNPAAPWLQQGWGHVGEEIVTPAVHHILGIQRAPQKSAAAVAFQEAAYNYRSTLWQRL